MLEHHNLGLITANLNKIDSLLNRYAPFYSRIKITFVKADGQRFEVSGKVDDTLLDTIIANSLDQEFEGYGACEGTLTCSTCHVILKKSDYEKLPDKPSEDESDMLDLAFELTDTSRLGCQITLTKDLNGLEVRIPATINDIRR